MTLLYQRDASFYRNSKASNGGKFHLRGDGCGSCCGIKILQDEGEPLHSVPETLWCRRCIPKSKRSTTEGGR